MRRFSKLLKHLFVPHRGNAFRPHALRHKALTVYSVCLIAAQIFLGATLLVGPTVTSADANTLATNVIARTNIERTQAKLSLLNEDKKLDQAAQAKLNDMFAKNYWDHTGPGGETAWQFIDAAGYKYVLAGENLAKGFNNSTEAVEAWMNSPTHRANILNDRFEQIGVAAGSGNIGGKPTTLIVQIFGLPSPAYASGPVSASILGTTKIMPEVSVANAQIPSKWPYLALWTLLFGLVIVDGLMVRKLGLKASKPHLFSLRVALLVVALGIGILMVGFVGIA